MQAMSITEWAVAYLVGPVWHLKSSMLSLINQRVWLGHFELWPDEGEVVFRHAMALPPGDRPTLAQAASMIDAAVDAADRYFPAFDFLLKGSKTPADAMTACLFETRGNA